MLSHWYFFLGMYLFYLKLIYSGMVYLGLPSLISKLEYCLGEPVPAKKSNDIHDNKDLGIKLYK